MPVGSEAQIEVRFFGRLADFIGARDISFSDSSISTGEALRAHVLTLHPQAGDVLNDKGTRLVVNDEIVDWASPLSADDAIAIIPIVSGG